MAVRKLAFLWCKRGPLCGRVQKENKFEMQQEDIRSYIDNSLKHGIQLSTFRKEQIGGDSNRISYWYEDDLIIGHRSYREIRKTEVIQVKKRENKRFPGYFKYIIPMIN